MVNRISFNGCRYVVDENYDILFNFCKLHKINPKWIRYKEKYHKFYLRLWGSYKNKNI